MQKNVTWQAKWIWCNGPAQPRNFRLNFRKCFPIQKNIKSALLHIAADSRYRLYLNNEWIGDGPARSFPHLQQFDTYDVTSNLVNENILAASVNHYGEGTFQYNLGRAGFLCQIELLYADDSIEIIASDSSWNVCPFIAYQRRVPRISCQMPFEEQYDANLFPDTWCQYNFDEHGWEPAIEIGPVGMDPWKSMEPRTIPFLTREHKYARSVIDVACVKPVKMVETFHVKRFLMPDDKMINRHDYRGVVYTTILSPVKQKATLPRQYSMYLGPWYLNGKQIKHPGRGYTDIELEAGENLFVADLVGDNHYVEFILAVDAEHPVRIKAPLGGPGKWLVAGPLDDDFDEAKKQVQEILTLDGLKKSKHSLNFSNIADECAADVWNVIYSQKRVDGKPDILNLENMMFDNKSFTEIQPCENDIAILFDFAREVVGYTEFELEAPADVVLDAQFFEAINDGIRQETYSNRSSFRYITKNGRQRFLTEWRRGFRYMEITLRHIIGPVKIRYIRTIQSTYPAVERGQFKCSDSRLDQVWEVGRHTMLCCMEDVLTDCPGYEQTYWVGDGRSEALICNAAYGEWALVDRCVRIVPQSLFRSPLPESQVPSAWQNILTAWSLLWIQMAHEYWLYTNDRDCLKEVYPGIAQTLDTCKKYCDNEYGLLSLHQWNMFDWAGTDTEHDLVTHNNIFFVQALNRAAILADELGLDSDCEKWNSFKSDIINNINLHLWSDEKKGYIDSIHNDGTPSEVVSQQTNTLALLYDIAPPERVTIIKEYPVNPSKDMITFGSPFAMSYLLEQLGKSGEHQHILNIIRDRWGFMLDAGATTFWETFPGFLKHIPTRSHCHAWSAAPTYFLSRYQLGVAPLKPGFNKALIAPEPADLTWAKGAVPTKNGQIFVEWHKSETEFTLKIQLPEQVEAEIILPVDPAHMKTVLFDDQKEKPDSVLQIVAQNNRWIVECKPESSFKITCK